MMNININDPGAAIPTCACRYDGAIWTQSTNNEFQKKRLSGPRASGKEDAFPVHYRTENLMLLISQIA